MLVRLDGSHGGVKLKAEDLRVLFADLLAVTGLHLAGFFRTMFLLRCLEFSKHVVHSCSSTGVPIKLSSVRKVEQLLPIVQISAQQIKYMYDSVR